MSDPDTTRDQTIQYASTPPADDRTIQLDGQPRPTDGADDPTVREAIEAVRPTEPGLKAKLGSVRTGDVSDRELAALVRADQRVRWQQGDRVLAEHYLQDFPALRNSANTILDLVYNEVLLREEQGDTPDETEYIERFPEVGAELRRQFALHRQVHEKAPRPPSRTGMTKEGTLALPGGGPSVAGYEILSELGRGGMGVVYKARHVKLNRLVALKMILSGAHAGGDELTRFRIEAEAIATLQHPHIVQIYEVGEQEGRPFFALEFVDGGSLGQLIDNSPDAVPPREAAEMIERVALAMHAAHQRGIIHRDLKPDNVLLTHDRQPKITDFGLAKRLDSNAGQTQSGSIMGTPAYMAPEQASGNTRLICSLADVYALGAILYEMLTRRPPFDAESPLETLRQVVEREAIPPMNINPQVPHDLDTICLKCLEKDPKKRYGSAEALAADLRRFLNNEPIHARPIGPVERAVKWTRRRPAVAALIVVIIAAIATFAVLGARYHLQLQEAFARATTQEARALQEKRIAEGRLIRMTIVNGTQLVDDHDLIGAVPWFVRALQLEQQQKDSSPAREEMHRVRLAAILHQCPKTVQLWFHKGRVTSADFSPDGRMVVTACADGCARRWNADTGDAIEPPLKHDGVVQDAAFSAKGDRIVTASADGTARVWDAATGLPVTPPLKHNGPLYHAEFSPDGKLILSASADNTARVWEVGSGKEVMALNHEGPVRHATFSPDGNAIVTSSEDDTAKVWDARAPAHARCMLQHSDDVVHAAFSSDSKRVVTASSDYTGRVWDAVTGKPVSPPLAHKAPVVFAAFSPDDTRVVTTGEDSKAMLWKARTGEPVGMPMTHGSNVYSASFCSDGKKIATASDDNTARVWDATTGEPLSPPLKHNATVYRAVIDMHKDKGRLLTASADGTARIWIASSNEILGPGLTEEAPLSAALFSPDARLVLTATKKGTARLWNADTGQALDPAFMHQGPILAAAISPDGRWAATASADHTAQVWNVARRAPAGSPLEHGGEVRGVVFSPDSRLVATASADKTAIVWEAGTSRRVVQFTGHTDAVRSVAFSADGKHVVSASADHTAQVWSVTQTGAQPLVLRHNEEVFHAVFSPDGERVATASCDRTARIWDATTGQPIGAVIKHSSKIYYVAFDPSGQRVVTSSDDNTARVWSATTGEPLTPPMRHGGTVNRAVFGPTGLRIATGSEDNTARVWDAATGEPLTPPLPHAVGVIAVAFSPDGDRVLSGSMDRTARIWKLPPDKRPIDELVPLAKLLSGGWFDRTDSFVPIEPEEHEALWQQFRRVKR
jgi:WD40 repeat protein/tRNA A-37 threonylcarbamoyl transferase component Bud32